MQDMEDSIFDDLPRHVPIRCIAELLHVERVREEQAHAGTD